VCAGGDRPLPDRARAARPRDGVPRLTVVVGGDNPRQTPGTSHRPAARAVASSPASDGRTPMPRSALSPRSALRPADS
jgi:hypothetical protein